MLHDSCDTHPHGHLYFYTLHTVSPIGMKASTVPIIMSDRITELQPNMFFLGAGETDLKVSLEHSQVHDLMCKQTNANIF